MELQQMRYVVAVAELGSFTRAAERCFVVQSALSHQVARLEEELGTRLFHRTSRQVRLSPAGEAFLPVARQCLDAAERAVAEVAAATGEIRGTLAVGLVPTVAAIDVPVVLREFREQHPQVRLRLETGGSDDFLRQVAEGALDVAFLGLPEGREVTGVGYQLLSRDRHLAVLAPDHRLAVRRRLRLADLADEPFVDFPSGTAGREQSDRAFAAAGLAREVVFEVMDMLLMARLVRSGLAVGLLPSGYVAQVPDLVTLPVQGAPSRGEHVIWSGFGPAPAAAALLAQIGVPVR
ncbi:MULTISPECIES: LysR family transcriptional regulator [unclassified Nocardioides]|uniref:LysR family transcriptional regulator n=1 Tax=unclassified Nocardioides TaxID=2615069 RepID=UPI00070399D8|nr:MULTISPECIES: LysR family transcriptional regulator [unclassified Nocardioides]KRC52673.1 LysR family transcriptional regulator [Nocardioides sp. Root79]KRC72205.1 LysR family transcriptional regulator [Nocardioides sp. Root240]